MDVVPAIAIGIGVGLSISMMMVLVEWRIKVVERQVVEQEEIE